MRKQLKTGRPADVPMEVIRRDHPDNYPTVLRYLQAQGKVKHTSNAVRLKARNLYFAHKSPERIAKILNIDVNIIDRWVLIFGWDDERDRRLFNQFRQVSDVDRMYGKDCGQKHDRIAGSIEAMAERLLQRQEEGETLTPRDLATLASTIKSTQEIRRTSRGESVKKEQKNVHIQVSVPGNLDKLAGALVDAYDRPKLVQAKTRTIALGVEEAIGGDTEFEEALNRDSEKSE